MVSFISILSVYRSRLKMHKALLINIDCLSVLFVGLCNGVKSTKYSQMHMLVVLNVKDSDFKISVSL